MIKKECSVDENKNCWGDKRDIKSKMGIAVSKRGKIIIFIGREIGL